MAKRKRLNSVWGWLREVSSILGGSTKIIGADDAVLMEPDIGEEVTIVLKAESVDSDDNVALPGYRPLDEFELTRSFCSCVALSMLIRATRQVLPNISKWLVPKDGDFLKSLPVMIANGRAYRIVAVTSTGLLEVKPLVLQEDQADFVERCASTWQ